MITRRQLLKGAALMASSRYALAESHPSKTSVSNSNQKVANMHCFIPGYAPGSAKYKGKSILESVNARKHLPDRYQGPLTMLTRTSINGEALQRAIYPLQGHGVCLHPDGSRGFFAANRHPDNQMVAFDTATLEPVEVIKVNRKGWFGGGHATYTRGGNHLLISERYPEAPFSGRVDQHYGRICIRDASSYKVIEEYNCHGVAPHEITITADGNHLVIANYGSTRSNGTGAKGQLPEIVEPSLTILELSSGRLLEKIIGQEIDKEIRHLIAPDLQRIFAIQVKLGDLTQSAETMEPFDETYERDITSDKKRAYLAALAVHITHGTNNKNRISPVSGMDPFFARHGLSIVYDPRNDEVIASFPSSHCLAAFDAATGEIKKLIRTDRLGLRHPCGLALHPDGEHYIVTGYWRDQYVFKRGSHALNREACQYISLFGHSHIAIG